MDSAEENIRAGLPVPAWDQNKQCWYLDFGMDSPGHPIVVCNAI